MRSTLRNLFLEEFTGHTSRACSTRSCSTHTIVDSSFMLRKLSVTGGTSTAALPAAVSFSGRCSFLRKFSRRVAARRHVYGQIANGFYFQLFSPRDYLSWRRNCRGWPLNFILVSGYFSCCFFSYKRFNRVFLIAIAF